EHRHRVLRREIPSRRGGRGAPGDRRRRVGRPSRPSRSTPQHAAQPRTVAAMDSLNQTISDNLIRVRDRIARAAIAAKRDAREIRLVGVTKYVDAEAAEALLA